MTIVPMETQAQKLKRLKAEYVSLSARLEEIRNEVKEVFGKLNKLAPPGVLESRNGRRPPVKNPRPAQDKVSIAAGVMRRSRCPRRSHDNLRLVSQIQAWCAEAVGTMDARWDRILARIGNGGIPAAGGTKKAGFGAPGKSSRATFAFCSPRPPLGSLTKEMG